MLIQIYVLSLFIAYLVTDTSSWIVMLKGIIFVTNVACKTETDNVIVLNHK